MTISVLHIPDTAKDVRQYILDNVEHISAIKISANKFLQELMFLGVIEIDDVDSAMIVLRKITNRLFNNSHTRNRMPISIPEFVSSFVEATMLDMEKTSFLKVCYHYSIPVFIDDAGSFNNIFASDICGERTMFSSEHDWLIYSNMIQGDTLHFTMGMRHLESVFNMDRIKCYAGLDIGYPHNYELMHKESIASYFKEDVEIEDYMYDKLF